MIRQIPCCGECTSGAAGVTGGDEVRARVYIRPPQAVLEFTQLVHALSDATGTWREWVGRVRAAVSWEVSKG